eukprot:CAMPEP_0174369298 /NCGR_PEP_ID=MMETSP0811_2-20130205/91947_1 /TAXON_ID=73025 ORGANISM="Eutreptiella gymnastica-like, Strain CCMP1594" /NCGR_SAMPLE_ID=MMETSP0811_2 /ASSEMBLY_ACC=CAM_ASM_000667 /LENGTH=51 /DNA_ID=CAMNT_0015513575 /DNA_START=273 /DNA_END=424 /DNA_ORIENTATION=-
MHEVVGITGGGVPLRLGQTCGAPQLNDRTVVAAQRQSGVTADSEHPQAPDP